MKNFMEVLFWLAEYIFQFWKCGGPVRNKNPICCLTDISQQCLNYYYYNGTITPESSEPSLSARLCPPQRTCWRTFYERRWTILKSILLLKIKLANSPLVLFLHHLADHSHSLLSASCHSWLVQLRKNLVRCCIECMNTGIEDCTFLEPVLITSGLRLIKSAVEVSLFSFPFSSIQPSWYRTHQSPVVVCKRCWSINTGSMSVICFEL